MSGLGCDRTHGRSGSAQIETNKFQSTLPEGSDRRHQQICGASLRRRVERPHHDTSQVVHLLKIPDFLFVSILIKAYYLRATTNAQFKEVLRMDINEESGYLPYVLGRMFSIYEQIQLAAIPGINTTIKDKYFTSASTTPARIFPILGDLAAKHMRKTWKSEGLKVKLDKALGELTGRVGDRYPSRLSLEERGAFQLGYYFENQKRFDKANKNNNEQGENND